MTWTRRTRAAALAGNTRVRARAIARVTRFTVVPRVAPFQYCVHRKATPRQRRLAKSSLRRLLRSRWRGPESNRRHHGFQPCALPTELPRLESSSLAAILFGPPEGQTVLVSKLGASRVGQLFENRLGLLAAPAKRASEVGR